MATVLATGGAAALWARTTNPRGSSGVGLALAHAAGAGLADLEFVQFHPTALVSDGPRDGFLVTEAVRGEGATLLGAGGRAVRRRAGAARRGGPGDRGRAARRAARAAVALDMRSVDLGRFPNIAEALGEVGIDPARRPGAGGAGRPLHDGRRGHRPRRARLDRARCTRWASARAPACTGPTAWRRTRSRSASCSDGGPRWPPAPSHRLPTSPAPPGPRCPPRPPTGTRAALWRHAGLRRDAEGLRRPRARRVSARAH